MTNPIAPLQMLAGINHFDKSNPHWTLSEASAEATDRELSIRIEFECEFASPPVVHVGLAGLDAEGADAVRLRLQARHIDKNGFTLLLSTWLGSRVHGVDVSWLALGH
jgi:hypothetical protein